MPNTFRKTKKIHSNITLNPLKNRPKTCQNGVRDPPKHHFKLCALILVFLVNLDAIWEKLLSSFGIQNPYKNMLF
jgi:hypothetical protein